MEVLNEQVRKDVTLTVRDEEGNYVLSVKLWQRTEDDIANAVASLQATFIFCEINIEEV